MRSAVTRRWLPPLVMMLALLGMPGVAPAAEAPPEWWVRLSDRSISAELSLHVAPASPDDPLLLATTYTGRTYDLHRSRDGARTWQNVRWPGHTVSAVAPPFGGIRPIFARNFFSELYRSVDEGESWTKDLSTIRTSGFVLSPAFSEDGLALLSGGEGDRPAGAPAGLSLFLGRDGGARWERIEPLVGTDVRQALFSPSFAADRTIFALTASGVAVSKDGGASWSAPTNLVGDGVAYAEAGALAASPSFADDGILFGLAGGPPDQPAPVLLRSRDSGLTWQRLHTFSDSRSSKGTIALSPTFAADRTVLVGTANAGAGGAAACEIVRSVDAGDTWEVVGRVGSTCDSLRLLRRGDLLVGLQQGQLSLDGGATWQRLTDPTGLAARQLVPAPTFVGDGLLFVVTNDGRNGPSRLWAVGPSARAMYGTDRCLVRPTGGFGRLFESERDVGAALGCPTGYETPTRIRERQAENGRLLWIDDSPYPRELGAGQPEGWATGWVEGWDTLRVLNDGDAPPPDGGLLIEGSTQSFEQGEMLFLPRPDGPRTIIVVVRNSWREWPD